MRAPIEGRLQMSFFLVLAEEPVAPDVLRAQDVHDRERVHPPDAIESSLAEERTRSRSLGMRAVHEAHGNEAVDVVPDVVWNKNPSDDVLDDAARLVHLGRGRVLEQGRVEGDMIGDKPPLLLLLVPEEGRRMWGGGGKGAEGEGDCDERDGNG